MFRRQFLTCKVLRRKFTNSEKRYNFIIHIDLQKLFIKYGKRIRFSMILLKINRQYFEHIDSKTVFRTNAHDLCGKIFLRGFNFIQDKP